jgi:hypothetical protein
MGVGRDMEMMGEFGRRRILYFIIQRIFRE